MPSEAAHTLPKMERLCGRMRISELLKKGRYGNVSCLRFCYLRGGETSRIVVSVPKKFFPRAVKRNLLKRRIRESYRLQKELLPEGTDVMFIYVSREILPFSTIYSDMTEALTRIAEGKDE